MSLTLTELIREDKNAVYEFPAPENIKDKKGNRPTFKMRILTTQEQLDIRNIYTKRTVMMDKKGRPFPSPTGDVMYRTDTDDQAIGAHLLAASLVEPDLMNKEERERAGYVTIYDAVDDLFGSAGTQYIMRVFNALHYDTEMPEDDEGKPIVSNPVGEAKNS